MMKMMLGRFDCADELATAATITATTATSVWRQRLMMISSDRFLFHQPGFLANDERMSLMVEKPGGTGAGPALTPVVRATIQLAPLGLFSLSMT
jgi:hypothetical protein